MPAPTSAPNPSRFRFSRFSRATSTAAGRPITFILAVGVILGWAVTGPIFHYSDTWQLVINTGTTVITFLMVFLIQNTQNRDSQSIHFKLDELIRAAKGARNSMIDLDDLTDAELARIQEHYQKLAQKSKHELRELKEDTVTVSEVVKK